MKFYYLIAILSLMVWHNPLVASDNPLRLVYKDKPIPINLRIGYERHFIIEPKMPIQVGIPDKFKHKISVTTIDGQVWLLAKERFSNAKVIFKSPQHRIVLVVDAEEDYEAGLAMILVVGSEQHYPGDSKTQQRLCDVNLVELARYAFQWAYAPERLIKNHPCIHPTSYPKRQLDLLNCLSFQALVCGGGVISTPVAAWRSGSHYLNLLEVQNTLKTTVELDPRTIAGDFKAAAFAHHRLAPVDTVAESVTALVLIGSRALSESVARERWLDEN